MAVGDLTHIDFDDIYGVRSIGYDSNFIYVASQQSIQVYSVDDLGNLTHENSESIFAVSDFWTNDNLLYTTENYHLTRGIRSYSVDNAGNLTQIDEDTTLEYPNGIWGDGTFVYVAESYRGLHSYSTDGNGNFTHIDYTDTNLESPMKVWGDGTFIYVADYGNGIHSYSVDESGNLTHIDNDDRSQFYEDVCGDDNFVYLSNSTTVYSYSVDESGNFTYIDNYSPPNQGSPCSTKIYADNDFVYAAHGKAGLYVYSVDSNGVFTLLDSHDPSGCEPGAVDVCADNNFIYLIDDATDTYPNTYPTEGPVGLHIYSVKSVVSTHYYNGESGTGTTITNLRFKTADDNEQSLYNPMIIPSSGDNFSYWKHIAPYAISGPKNSINNVKIYSDATLWAGHTLKIAEVMNYDQAVDAVDASTNHTDTPSMLSASNYTEETPLSLTGSFGATTGKIIDGYVLLQITVANDASTGILDSKTLTWSYDET